MKERLMDIYLEDPDTAMEIIDSVVAEFEALEAALAEQQWVSVEDRLPPNGITVDTKIDYGSLPKRRVGNSWLYDYPQIENHSTHTRKPTHWRPLPAPPEGRDE